MSLLNCFRTQHDVIRDTRTLPALEGLNLVFSHFDGYSPPVDGSIRVTVVESSGFKESKDIAVTIGVRASSPSCKDNIRINQQDNNIFIATGGLSLLSYATAPRLIIDVSISLPRSTVGDLSIKTLSLPVFIHAVESENDVVIHTESSPIQVAKVNARSLAVSSSSGSITFEPGSTQNIDKFTRVSNSSGSTRLHSSIFSPVVSAESSSGSLGLAIKTTATELTVKNSSGAISGLVEYVSDDTNLSSYENSSGSTSVRFRGWSGFLTATTSSGSKTVKGSGLERWNDGWKKGNGNSTAKFASQSGSIKVDVL